MNPTAIWLMIAGMAITNLVLRATPIAIMSRLDLPPVVRRWLGYVPVSVMAAIVAVQVFRPADRFDFTVANPYLLAAIPTALVYRFTRSFLGAVLAGILTFLTLRYLPV
jgi:branched-subunit amino acid transport protein